MLIDTQSRPAITARVRRWVRVAIRAIRCQNRFFARYILNAGPIRRYRRSPAELTTEAVRVSAELRTNGVAMSTMADLMGSAEAFTELRDHATVLRQEWSGTVDPEKPFLIELLGASPAIAPTDPLAQFALQPAIRGIAEAYSEMQLRVQDVNVWINLPTGSEPSQSQRWHRDLPEDYDIVKCFVYLSDVPEGAGPLQYVRGTNTRSGRRLRFKTEFDGVGYRVGDGDITDAFPAERIAIAAGSAGSVVFADTRGIHRGGFAVDAERVVLQITYASQASCRPRNLRAAPGVDPETLRGFRLSAA